MMSYTLVTLANVSRERRVTGMLLYSREISTDVDVSKLLHMASNMVKAMIFIGIIVLYKDPYHFFANS